MNKIKRLIEKILEYLGYEIFKKGTNKGAFDVQRELVKIKTPIIFDVGAYVGEVTGEYRTLFPSSNIYSFEPFPPSFSELKKRYSTDPKVFLFNQAISKESGSINLNVNKQASTNSILNTDATAAKYWGANRLDTQTQMEVHANTIDNFCSENGIEKIDILKLDIQGHEYDAFLGAEKMFRSNSVHLIYFEMILAPSYIKQHKLCEYIQLLEDYGFELFDFYNAVKRDMQIISMDMLFINKKFYSDKNII